MWKVRRPENRRRRKGFAVKKYDPCCHGQLIILGGSSSRRLVLDTHEAQREPVEVRRVDLCVATPSTRRMHERNLGTAKALESRLDVVRFHHRVVEALTSGDLTGLDKADGRDGPATNRRPLAVGARVEGISCHCGPRPDGLLEVGHQYAEFHNA